MTCRVRVLCTERRTECINTAECLRIGLAVQLSAYRQVGLFSKEILTVIDASVFVFRKILHIQRRYTEHLSRTLAVASGDQRSVHIHKSPLLEKAVDRICRQRAHAEYCLKCIGSRTQM